MSYSRVLPSRIRFMLPLFLILLLASLSACQTGAEPTPQPVDTATATAEPEETQVEAPAAEDAAAAAQTFSIVADGSEARFIIDEVLMGNDKTVVGVTSDVTGEITLDPTNPSASQIGVITINAARPHNRRR